jgi:hypothetical protein
MYACTRAHTHSFSGTGWGSFISDLTNADWLSTLYSNHHLTTLLHTLHLCIQNQVIFLWDGVRLMISCRPPFSWDRTRKGWYSGPAMSCLTKAPCASIPCRSKILPFPPKFLSQICRTPYSPIQWTMGSSFPSNKAAMAWSWPNTSIYYQDQECA